VNQDKQWMIMVNLFFAHEPKSFIKSPIYVICGKYFKINLASEPQITSGKCRYGAIIFNKLFGIYIRFLSYHKIFMISKPHMVINYLEWFSIFLILSRSQNFSDFLN
jgi:hypothetical protein